MKECCHVDDTSPERAVTGLLQAESIPALTDRTSSIALSQVVRGRPPGLLCALFFCQYMSIMFFLLWAASYDGLMPSLAACHCYN